MKTICLDESGNFEDQHYLKKFIGGIIYEGKDYKEEERRLEEFFKDQCKQFRIEYPKDIHTTDMNNSSSTKEVKESLIENIKKYIKENGNYRFTYLVKASNTRSDFKNISNIVDDNNAANLYERMMCNLINNLLFYNMDFSNEKDFILEIATRICFVRSEEERKKFEQLGYSSNENIFYITDQRTYKSAITNKMIENKIDKFLNINLKVRSINYDKNEKEYTPFLYLADFACDIIRDTLEQREKDFNIQNSKTYLSNITGKQSYCWVYDDIDGLYNELYICFYKKELIGFLDKLYLINKSESDFKVYYVNNWCKPLLNRIKDIFIKDKLDIYISELEYLFSKNVAQYEKGLFMCCKIIEIIYRYNENADNFKDKIKGKYLYRINDLMIRGYNHRGDIVNGKKCYEICKKYKDEVSIEEYMATMNRIVEIDANMFNFDSAIEKLQENMVILNMWKETKLEIAELMGLKKQRAACMELRGKTLSSLGQFYSFKKQKIQAFEYFNEALKEFEDNKIQADVTISYLLHAASDIKDVKMYKQYEQQYFGTDNLEEQFKNIVMQNNEKNSNDYKLFTYIKALNTIYENGVSDSLLKKIQITDYKNLGFKIDRHPWELIYKNIGILMYKNGYEKYGDNFIEKAKKAVNNRDITIELINYCGQLERAIYYKDKDKKQNIIKNIGFVCEKSLEVQEYFKECLEHKNIDEAAEKIVKKFTYMYK